MLHLWTRRWLPSLVGCSLAVIGLIAEARALPSSDVAFYLFGARRIVEGARLYRDLVEVNPPLVFWLNIPPVLLANALHLPDMLIYRLSVLVLLIAALALSQEGLRRIGEDPRNPPRPWINVLLVFALFTLPGEAFGQREHLMLALVLPYLLSVTALAGSSQPIRRGWIIGLLAGIGFCLKPYFLLLWVALEIWLWWKAPATRRIRSDVLTAALVVVGYGMAVFLLTPEYFPLVRLLGGAYRGYLSMPVGVTLIAGKGSAVPLLALLAYLALYRLLGQSVLAQSLAVASAALLLAGALQQKGWWYHFYPSAAVSVILLGVLVSRAWGTRPKLVHRLYTLSAAGALVFVLVSAVAHCVRVALRPLDDAVTRYPGFHQLQDLVRRRASGRTVMVWSFNIQSAFPLVPSSGAKWGSSFPSMWLVPASYWAAMVKTGPVRFRPLAERSAGERLLDSVMVSDMRRHPPELLIVLTPSRDSAATGFRRLDFREYFAMDQRIARMLDCYRYINRIGVHDVYQRSTEPRCQSS